MKILMIPSRMLPIPPVKGGAVQNLINFYIEWNEKENKLLSVISLNGFIIAYNRQLKQNGLQNFQFYDNCLKKLKIDFSNDKFKYTSSQYRKFSDEILKKAFGIDIETN